jgi:radical SAM superfamily enzyme YgiQ (UPF0313 family)
MKIALLYPEVYDLAHFKDERKEFPPFGVLYLATIAEQIGSNVELFKINNSEQVFDLQEFDIVGFSISSSATYHMMKSVRSNSLYSNSKFLIAGGIHATLFPEEVLEDMNLDIICIGEGEETFLEILSNFELKSFHTIKGICYIDNNKILKNADRSPINNIDTIPFPARHLLNEEDFILTNRLSNTNIKMTHIMTSRGCPFSCKFCANVNKNLRYRTGQNIINELQNLKSTYGIEGFCITDDNFIIDQENVKNICYEIKKLNLKWSALSRVDTINEDILRSMYDSGCIEIKFGIESGSKRILEAMNKGITRDQIINAVSLTKNIGINVKAFLIHGFPGENLQTTRETISLLEDISGQVDRVSLFRFVPLPGSFVYNNSKSYNLNIDTSNDDFCKFHIYDNDEHWWGTKAQFDEMKCAYEELRLFIEKKWGKY